jgi:hypothetical protein
VRECGLPVRGRGRGRGRVTLGSLCPQRTMRDYKFHALEICAQFCFFDFAF